MRTGSPFVGPQPLGAQTRIHGRERELRELSNLLITRRIVLLYSPSGAGKSSLINAAGGLLDRLGRGSAQPLLDVRPVTRVHTEPPAGTALNRFTWSVLNGLGLANAGSLSEAISPSIKGSTLIMFDQFEEILRIDPTGSDAKREFFRQLGELLMDARIWALLALREDYLAPLDPFRVLIPTRLEERYRLDLLTLDAAAETARQTTASAGVTFGEDALTKLLNDLTVGGGPVEPLQLQLVCGELWRNLKPDATRIEVDDVRRFGDVSAVLRKFYEDALTGAAGEDQYAVRTWIDKQLITPDGTRGQVLESSSQAAGVAMAVAGQLVDAYLLLREQRMNAAWLELAHDRLVEPVRNANAAWFSNLSEWEQRVRNWAEEKNPDLRASHLITGRALHQARQWFGQHAHSVVRNDASGYFAACAVRQRQIIVKRAAITTLALLLVLVSVALVVVKHQEDLIRAAGQSAQSSNTALKAEVTGLDRQQAALQSEVEDLRRTQEDLTEKNAGLAAESARLVPHVKELSGAGDGLLKQIHDLDFDRKGLVGKASDGIKSTQLALNSLRDTINANNQLSRTLHAANLENRELMTRIIHLGLPLPTLPLEVDRPMMIPMVAADQAMVPPPPFVLSPDAYLKELLARNAELLAQLKQLGLANDNLAAEASALRKQNDKLTAIQSDLREQIARMQDELRLLTAVNNLRRNQVADLTSTNQTLRSQLQILGTAETNMDVIAGLLNSERAEMGQWNDAVTAINKVLSQAIANRK